MKILKPDQVLESVLAVDWKELKRRSISGLLLDIDNTLVRWKQSRLEAEFVQWVKAAQTQGFKLCLVSNALEKRAAAFADYLDIPAVGRAWKPLSRAFRRGLEVLQLEASEVAVVGDQLFTDVFGGNRLGLYTILVNPLSSKEFITTRLVRSLERRVLAKMVKRGSLSPQSLEIRQGKN